MVEKKVHIYTVTIKSYIKLHRWKVKHLCLFNIVFYYAITLGCAKGKYVFSTVSLSYMARYKRMKIKVLQIGQITTNNQHS